jgi:hypothetical protein
MIYPIMLSTKKEDAVDVHHHQRALLFVVFLTSLLVKLFDDVSSDREGSASLARRVLGFDSSVSLSMILVVIVPSSRWLLLQPFYLTRLAKCCSGEKLREVLPLTSSGSGTPPCTAARGLLHAGCNLMN